MDEWNADCSISNTGLVHKLRRHKVIQSDIVEAAMLSVDRAKFCPGPNIDQSQKIGYGASITIPQMHAHALELLKDHLTEGNKALDVGSGSGYLTACMAIMVGTKGKVIGIDHIPELVQLSVSNVGRGNQALLNSGRVRLIVGDGRMGFPEESPYDAIHVGAAASFVPRALIHQLKPGGRMVMPVGEGTNQVSKMFDKSPNGIVREMDDVKNIKYARLIDREQQWPSGKGPVGGPVNREDE